MKHANILFIGVLDGEEREQGIEHLFEKIMTEYFSNLMKEREAQVQEMQRVPNKVNLKRPISRHIIIKMSKVKDKKKI